MKPCEEANSAIKYLGTHHDVVDHLAVLTRRHDPRFDLVPKLFALLHHWSHLDCFRARAEGEEDLAMAGVGWMIASVGAARIMRCFPR